MGGAKSRSVGAISAKRPRYITTTRSLRWRTTPRSWEMNKVTPQGICLSNTLAAPCLAREVGSGRWRVPLVTRRVAPGSTPAGTVAKECLKFLCVLALRAEWRLPPLVSTSPADRKNKRPFTPPPAARPPALLAGGRLLRTPLHAPPARRGSPLSHGFVKLLKRRRSSGKRVPLPGPTHRSGSPLRARNLAPTLESIPGEVSHAPRAAAPPRVLGARAGTAGVVSGGAGVQAAHRLTREKLPYDATRCPVWPPTCVFSGKGRSPVPCGVRDPPGVSGHVPWEVGPFE